MPNLNNLNLKNAEDNFFIANTPIFFMRKLLSDPVVEEVRKTLSPEEIIVKLNEISKTQVTSLREAVLPFVLLVALSFESNKKYLIMAANINVDRNGWFKYISQVLLEIHNPAEIFNFRVPNLLESPKISFNTQNSTQRITFSEGHL